MPFPVSELNSSKFYPNPPQKIEFSEYVSGVSKEFVEIYNQANQAETMGLLEISGIGYRKFLEFLIKDYLISKLKTEPEKEVIKKKPLGDCIKQNVDDPRIKKVAERAVWIGNDETHYLRKHEGKDISDLKALIDLTIRWIEMIEMTAKYTKEIQPQK